MQPELDPATYGLTIWDLEREFLTGGLGGVEQLELGEILRILRDAYCRTIGIEYMHIQDTAEQKWIQEQVEGVRFALSHEEQLHLLVPPERRRGVREVPRHEVRRTEALRPRRSRVGDRHPRLDPFVGRGRGSRRSRCSACPTAAGSTCWPTSSASRYDQIFREFEGYVDPTSTQGSGDVKYHLGASGKFVSPAGADIKVELAANPSHLEAVDPVVGGHGSGARKT